LACRALATRLDTKKPRDRIGQLSGVGAVVVHDESTRPKPSANRFHVFVGERRVDQLTVQDRIRDPDSTYLIARPSAIPPPNSAITVATGVPSSNSPTP
ncbi:MAG: hypothetical protein ACI9CV_001464, partial [Ilumatobacter sp.]